MIFKWFQSNEKRSGLEEKMKKRTSKLKFALVFLIVVLLFLVYFRKRFREQIEITAPRSTQTETVKP